jgi:hypothetical protein
MERSTIGKTIKTELKKVYPEVKFSVKYSSYSMGDSIKVYWTDGPNQKEVQSLIDKYQYGHFNGMEDLYEYSNKREDLPQAKFVFANRELSPEYRKHCEGIVSKYYGIENFNPEVYNEKFQCYGSTLFYRYMQEKNI